MPKLCADEFRGWMIILMLVVAPPVILQLIVEQLHEAFINRLDDIETNVQKTFEKFNVTTDQLLELAGRKKRMDEGYEGYKAGITTPKEEPDLRKHHKIKKGRGAIRSRKKSKSADGGSFQITDTLG